MISLLSGHGRQCPDPVPGRVLKADPVITTATDVNALAALDMLAVQLDADMLACAAASSR